MSFLPRFVRRRVLLARARERLAAGDPRGALAVLADPACAGSPAAADLARAAELHLASLPKDGPSAALRDLLARMRAERDARGDARAPGAHATSESRADDTPRVARLARFRLAVDDAGEYLVVAGTDVVLGHTARARVDLPFLADVGAEHARLVLTSDFRSGLRWRLVPLGRASLTCAGRAVPSAGADVHDGERIVFAPNLEARFHAPDPASASAVLEFLHGGECRGASRVMLLVPGPEGRVRVGPALARTVRVPGLEQDVTLELARDASGLVELIVACAAGVGRGRRPEADAPRDLRLALPPRASERITLGARARDRAPFEIVLASDPEDADGAGP